MRNPSVNPRLAFWMERLFARLRDWLNRIKAIAGRPTPLYGLTLGQSYRRRRPDHHRHVWHDVASDACEQRCADSTVVESRDSADAEVGSDFSGMINKSCWQRG